MAPPGTAVTPPSLLVRLNPGAVVSGVVLEQDREATRALYGKDEDMRSILAGKVATPPLAKDFMDAIEAAINAASGR